MRSSGSSESRSSSERNERRSPAERISRSSTPPVPPSCSSRWEATSAIPSGQPSVASITFSISSGEGSRPLRDVSSAAHSSLSKARSVAVSSARRPAVRVFATRSSSGLLPATATRNDASSALISSLSKRSAPSDPSRCSASSITTTSGSTKSSDSSASSSRMAASASTRSAGRRDARPARRRRQEGPPRSHPGFASGGSRGRVRFPSS